MPRTVYEKADVVPLVAEVFRELGYEGASMSRITARTGLSKGSIYHFFPGGKDEMAAAVLAHVDSWFAGAVFGPLAAGDPARAIARMWDSVQKYFQSGRRICIVGAFALDETRDHFAVPIRDYFRQWIEALRNALVRSGMDRKAATRLAEEAVCGIQGALVLARALDEPAIFARAVKEFRTRTTPNMT